MDSLCATSAMEASTVSHHSNVISSEGVPRYGDTMIDKQRDRCCGGLLIPLPLGISLIATLLVAVSGFGHFIHLSGIEITIQGVQTYTSSISVSGNSVIRKMWSEIQYGSSLTSILEQNPSRFLDTTNSVDWDVPLHAQLHAYGVSDPAARWFYVDVNTMQYTSQLPQGPSTVRLRGLGYATNPARYDLTSRVNGSFTFQRNGSYKIFYSPLYIALIIVNVGQSVWFSPPYLDFNGNFAYGIGYILYGKNSSTSALDKRDILGVLYMVKPLENIAPQWYDVDQFISNGGISATYDGQGALVFTTHPKLGPLYLDASYPGAACMNSAPGNFTRCRQSYVTMGSTIWPELAEALRVRPDVKTAPWLGFVFNYDGSTYLCTSGTIVLSFDPWFSVVITPADQIFGTYFVLEKKIVGAIIGFCVASVIVVAMLVMFLSKSLTVSLDDLTAALALRPRRSVDSDYDLRRRDRKTSWLPVPSEIFTLDESIEELQESLEEMATHLPPQVIAALRKNVRRRHRALTETHSILCFSLGKVSDAHEKSEASCGETSDPDTFDVSKVELLEEENRDDNSVVPSNRITPSETALSNSGVHNLVIASEREYHNSYAHRQALDNAPDAQLVTEQRVDNTTVPSTCGDFPAPRRKASNQSETVGAQHEISQVTEGITLHQPLHGSIFKSTTGIASIIHRQRGLFLSLHVTFPPTASENVHKLIPTIANVFFEEVWAAKGDVEKIDCVTFFASFGCYGDGGPDLANQVVACGFRLLVETWKILEAAAGNEIPGGSSWRARNPSAVSIVLDAGRFEEKTVSAAGKDGALVRRRLITTAAAYSCQLLHTLCQELKEPFVVVDDARRNLKFVVTPLDSVVFSSLGVPRLAKRGTLTLYRVETSQSAANIAAIRRSRPIIEAALKQMRHPAKVMQTAAQLFGVVDCSVSARRLLAVCDDLLRQPVASAYSKRPVPLWELLSNAEVTSVEEQKSGSSSNGATTCRVATFS